MSNIHYYAFHGPRAGGNENSTQKTSHQPDATMWTRSIMSLFIKIDTCQTQHLCKLSVPTCKILRYRCYPEKLVCLSSRNFYLLATWITRRSFGSDWEEVKTVSRQTLRVNLLHCHTATHFIFSTSFSRTLVIKVLTHLGNTCKSAFALY